MKRWVSVIIISLLLLSSAFALEGDSAQLGALRYSALNSAAFWGSFDDVFLNPAALPLIKEEKTYEVSASVSETYNSSIFGSSPSSYYQNLNNEVQGVVVAGPIGVSAKFSNRLTNRKVENNTPYFDIYTGIDIEIDVAYRLFKNLSLGVSLSGGNSLVREHKSVSNVVDVVQNALFSPYAKGQNSERFIPSFGLLLFNDNLSLGLTTSTNFHGEDKLLDFLKNILSNTSIAIAYQGNSYSSSGDLNFLVPRISASFSGIGGGSNRSLSVSGDLSFQILKNAYLDCGVKYLYLVNSIGNGGSNILAFSLFGVFDDFSLGLNFAYDFSSEYNIHPAIVFSYSR